MSMTLDNIFSQLEDISRKLDNRDSKIESIKSAFDKKLGIGKEEHDKVVSLIEQLEDSEESLKQYDTEIKDTKSSLNSLNQAIQDLRDELSKGILSPTEQAKKLGELDDKVTERNRLEDKKDRLDNNIKQEERRNSKLKAKLNTIGIRDTTNAIKANKEMEKATAAAAKGGGMTKTLGGMKGNIYVAVAQMLINVIEFGIGKATEYAKVAGESLMRSINASVTVSLNQMKAGFDAWQDAVSGAYSAQMLAAESQLELLKAQNANTLASYKLENTWTNWIPIWGAINKYNETALEIEQQLAETRMQNANKVIAQVNEFTKKTDDYIKKQDKAVHQYQTLNGLSIAQTQAFEKRLFAQGQAFSQFNKTIEDALKIQNSYTEQSGRSINFSDNDFKQSFAVGRLVGEDNLTTFQAQMQVFNHSVAESADIMYQMYKDANKMGLSQQKLVKNVLNNLKLANKYDFKNGTKGFIELAKWAENVRFNLGSLGGAVEKVQSGGLEGVITQAAKLQVLGGRFAMNADPIAMYYEAFADQDSYAKRIVDSLDGMGNTDSVTGETTFAGTDNMMLRSAAEAWNMPVEELKDIVREERKKQTVKKQMGASTLSGKQKDLVANKAQRDETTGEWYVETLQGQRIEVNRVKESDLNNLKAEDTEKTAVEYAKGTYGFVEKIEQSTKNIDSMLGKLSLDNFSATVNKTIEATTNAYATNATSVVTAIENNRFKAYNDLSKMLEHLKSIDGQYANALQVIANNGQLTEEQKGQELRERFRNGTATPEDYDLLKENPQYRKGLSIEEQKQIRKHDTRTISALWDWHRDSNWVAGKEGDDVTNYRNVALAQGHDKLAQTARRQGHEIEARLHESNALRVRGKPSIAQRGLEKSAFGHFTRDGIFTSNGSSMAVAATNITPIQDGSVKLATTDPKDVGLFAKTGGPFDTLFNDIFGRIDAVYNMIEPLPMKYSSLVMDNSSIVSSDIGGNIKLDQLKIEINGSLDLSSGGQNINIISELQNNPILLRALSQMLTEQLSKSLNGGRGSLPISIGNV